MQICLGRMFASDPGFTRYYDRLHPGLARWLCRAIDHCAREHGIDPDQATWG